MKCDDGRYFDPIRKECRRISFTTATTRKTTTTTTTTMSPNKKSKMLISLLEDTKFSCTGKMVGKYPDSRNCQMYHFCLPINFAPLRELIFTCPDGFAYEPQLEQCVEVLTVVGRKKNPPISPEAIMTVVNNNSENEGGDETICKTDVQFCAPTDAEVDDDGNQNCDGYYLCFGNRIVYVKCPNMHRFNEKLLRCEKV